MLPLVARIDWASGFFFYRDKQNICVILMPQFNDGNLSVNNERDSLFWLRSRYESVTDMRGAKKNMTLDTDRHLPEKSLTHTVYDCFQR